MCRAEAEKEAKKKRSTSQVAAAFFLFISNTTRCELGIKNRVSAALMVHLSSLLADQNWRRGLFEARSHYLSLALLSR
jgi:hypothetical protein